MRLDHGRRELSSLPLRHRVEFSTVAAAAVKFFGSRPAEINWDLKHHNIRCVSGRGKHSKNCVSLLVSKNRSQKLTVRTWNNRVRLVFSICKCVCIRVVIDMVTVYNNMTSVCSSVCLFVSLVGFYVISTFLDNLIPNPFLFK